MLKKNDQLSTQIGAAIRAFRSEHCPACEGEKFRVEDPFCTPCLGRLPESLRDAFHDRSRFLELFHPAMAHLREH